MTTKSLPPYDEYANAAPPTYSVDATTSNINSTIPNDIEVYRPSLTHFILSKPILDASTKATGFSRVQVVISTNTDGISMTPEAYCTMHSTPDASSGVVGRVRVTSSSAQIMTIYRDPEMEAVRWGAGGPMLVQFNKGEKKEKGGEKEVTFSFEFDRDGNGDKETFEWVQSGDENARALATSNINKEDYSQTTQAIKLISKTSPETPLAYFTDGQRDEKLNPRKLAAKLRFQPSTTTSNTHQNENQWRVLVLLSMISILETERMGGVERLRSGAGKSHAGLVNKLMGSQSGMFFNV